MATKDRVSTAEGVESFNRNKALVGQQDIERETTVALAQDHAIAFVPFRFRWAIAQHVVIEHAHDLNKGHRRANVTAPATVKSAHDQPTQMLRPFIQRRCCGRDAVYGGSTPHGLLPEVLQQPNAQIFVGPCKLLLLRRRPSFPRTAMTRRASSRAGTH
jgi:hypothetical protein